MEIHWRLTENYDMSVLCSKMYINGITLKSCQTNVADKQSEHLSLSTTEGHFEQVQALILDNRKVTIEVAKQLQISHGCASEIIHHRLHFHKFVQGWIQESLDYTIDITVQTYITAF
jgi:hypothetical protein